MRDNGSPRSLMCLFNDEILCLQMNVLELHSSQISWERDVSFHLAHRSRHAWYRVAPISHELDLELVGSFGKLLGGCPSARWACSEPNYLFHSCFNEIFGGDRGDMKTFSYKTSPVFILTTFGAFDRHAKSFAFSFNAYSSSWSSGISVSLLFKFITNLFDPWEILTQEWVLSLSKDQILISTPYLPCQKLVTTSNTGPTLVFPWIQPIGCEASSSLGRVYSRQANAWNCERSSVFFVMKYCPISTTLTNPASIHNLLNLSCCDSFSIRSPYVFKRKIWYAGSWESKGTNFCLDGTEHGWGTWLSHHNGSLRSLVKEFILFTHLCDCSAKLNWFAETMMRKVSIVSWSAA